MLIVRLLLSVGRCIISKSKLILIRWQPHKKRVKYYCRSRKTDDDVDLSKLVKKFGGGGHENAAGFTVPSEKGLEYPFDNIESDVKQ